MLRITLVSHNLDILVKVKHVEKKVKLEVFLA